MNIHVLENKLLLISFFSTIMFTVSSACQATQAMKKWASEGLTVIESADNLKVPDSIKKALEEIVAFSKSDDAATAWQKQIELGQSAYKLINRYQETGSF